MKEWEAYHKVIKSPAVLAERRVESGLKSPKVPERSAPKFKFRHSKGRSDGSGRTAIKDSSEVTFQGRAQHFFFFFNAYGSQTVPRHFRALQ